MLALILISFVSVKFFYDGFVKDILLQYKIYLLLIPVFFMFTYQAFFIVELECNYLIVMWYDRK